ncbi:MAG: PBECR2 nuclease fold domain-containing protein [Magnetospiraceae bacterium]
MVTAWPSASIKKKDPDEIWWRWEESRREPGKWMLRHRHVFRWEIAGRQESALTVFEFGESGWTGTTLFAPEPGHPTRQNKYLDDQRFGTLAYRRK